LLINELNHRVTNTLATVQAIAAQTLRGADVDSDLRDRFEGRLIAPSSSHSLLTQQYWEGADIGEIVRQTLQPQADTARLSIEGPRSYRAPRSAVAMAIHELATNASKCGTLSNETGMIAVSWLISGLLLQLTWRERGGPPFAATTRKGFGLA
jgi:two-component sensor histidine kinase